MSTVPKLFANQTEEYRNAREALDKSERELLEKIEGVAKQRRELPAGPVVEEDYVFDAFTTEKDVKVRLSDLVKGSKQKTLIMIHLMFNETDDQPCSMCNMWACGYDAIAPYMMDYGVNFVMVAKCQVSRLQHYADAVGWKNIRCLSSHNSTFNRDIGRENEDASQTPGVSVFQLGEDGKIRVTWSSIFYTRGIDLFTPVWNLMDTLPQGRGDYWPMASHITVPQGSGRVVRTERSEFVSTEDE